MAGQFEAFVDSDSYFRFRLLGPDGTEVAVSGPYPDKASLAAGIAAVRECAGTGLVTDLCPAGTVIRQVPEPASAPALVASEARRDCGEQPAGGHTFVLAKGPRRHGIRPRWATAAAR
ncbi:MAG: YegP family protein [Actinomycetes bacterium]